MHGDLQDILDGLDRPRIRRPALRRLDFSGEGEEQLLAVLEFFFLKGTSGAGRNPSSVWRRHGGWGFDVTTNGNGFDFPGEQPWGMLHNKHRGAPFVVVAKEIVSWLEGLEHDEKRHMCASLPTESMQALNPRLDGFRAMSTRTNDGLHYMLTIIPAWA